MNFYKKISTPPNALINNNATVNGNVLSVSSSLTFTDSIQGNWKVACIIVEDSVIGNGPQYSQANSYSGGTSLIDVDGSNWNAKPPLVPDYMMVYRNVARAIEPSFTGSNLTRSSCQVVTMKTFHSIFQLIVHGI